MFPTERMKLADIKEFPWCTVGFGGVPNNFAFIANDSSDLFRELSYGHIFSRADIYNSRVMVILHEEQTRICKVVDVKEFTLGVPVAPHDNLQPVLNFGFVEFPDHFW